MHYEIAFITPRRQRLKSTPAQQLVDEYRERAQRFAPLDIKTYASEAALLAGAAAIAIRTKPVLILLDARGLDLTSEAFALHLRTLSDSGVQRAILAIGPADGWSAAARQQATLLLSLGAMTLPHELALVVLTEQLYRALTILANHPYHTGHL